MENKELKIEETKELTEEIKDSKAKKVLSKITKHGKKLAVAAGAGVLLAVGGYIAGRVKGSNSDIDSDGDLEIYELDNSEEL